MKDKTEEENTVEFFYNIMNENILCRCKLTLLQPKRIMLCLTVRNYLVPQNI